MDLEEGQSYDLEQIKEQIEQRSRETFPATARDHLADYPKATERFREHFQQRGYPSEIVEAEIAGLKEEGFLDDERLARAHVRRRCESKPRGKRKLVAELRDKGIDRDLAREVVDEQVPEHRERELLEEFCEKNQRDDPDKLGRKLSSRGFPTHMIHEAVRERRHKSGTES